ncbi:hypothetical protein PWP93_29500 [Paraburkholderia sp. A1RI-2L]|uniref:hypothetical protein n=1 Tax=Paraburkholderia sp. A1RI-2L TaxID=3028367 RepID=UPI003B798468
MNTLHEVESLASRQVEHSGDPGVRHARPSSRTTSESMAAPACATNFPMLTPHEIATLMLVAHTPGQVSIERPDLLPLLTGDLVSLDRCRGKPQVTPLGEHLVVRLCRATQQASKIAS